MNPKATGHYITTPVAGESVQAFVPDPLPPTLTIEQLEDLKGPIRAAEAAIDRLRLAGDMIPSLRWFIYSFVRKEALLSSEIEGTQATLTDVLSYEQTGQPGSSDIADVEEVTNYVKAIDYAFKELASEDGLPVSTRLLDECHRRLMQGVRGANNQPGEIRRSQVWIGGDRPGNAVFVPPPHQEVRDLLTALQTYIHEDDDQSPLLRIAAAHVQFETIHPYLDGNGRVGRMLISLLLAHWNLLSSPYLYLSVYLKEHQKTYYSWLGKVRTEGDWIGWYRFFIDGVQQVAKDAEETAQGLFQLVNHDRKVLLAHESVTVSAIQLFELLTENPVISMPRATDLLKTTKPTATKAIQILSEAGVLKEIGKRKRDRLYGYSAYLDLLK
ncbi:MAG: Fic family protein [Woeseiaceae bacterium]